MDAVKFFKTAKRLCKDQGCRKCPACKEGVCMVMSMIRLDDNSVKSIVETISKVEQWAKDHPVKTRQSEFLKLFPNAQKSDGIINICPILIDEDYKSTSECLGTRCNVCRQLFWNGEVTDND